MTIPTILDSGTTIDNFTDLSRFQNFRKAPRNRNHFARILGYGTVDLDIATERDSKGILRIRNAAYCPDFMTNLVSLTKLMKRGIHWDIENRRLYRSIDRSNCVSASFDRWAACLESQTGSGCWSYHEVDFGPAQVLVVTFSLYIF